MAIGISPQESPAISRENSKAALIKEGNLFDIMLLEASEFPFLSKEQEKVLFQLISEHKNTVYPDKDYYTAEGRKIFGKALLKHIDPRHIDALDLSSHTLRASESIEEIILNSNIARVFKIASKYVNRGIPLDELFAEGYRGLVMLLPKVDLSISSFGNIATHYIEGYIRKCLTTKRKGFDVSNEVAQNLDHLQKIQDDYYQEYHSYPDKAYLYQQLSGKVKNTSVGAAVEAFLSPAFSQHILSLHMLSMEHDSGEECPIEDILGDDGFEEDLVDALDAHETIQQVFGLLTERERIIFSMHFGLFGIEKEHTIKEIAEKLGISRQAVEQSIRNAGRRVKKDEESLLND